MSQKYLFLCSFVLFVISGCIELPQTQAEAVGWNQAKYEEYSAFYESFNKTARDISRDDHMTIAIEIENKLVEIPKDKNEFEKTWYLAFLNYQRGLEFLAEAKDKERNCRYQERNNAFKFRCMEDFQKQYTEEIKPRFVKAQEYRQKIENMKVNLSR